MALQLSTVEGKLKGLKRSKAPTPPPGRRKSEWSRMRSAPREQSLSKSRQSSKARSQHLAATFCVFKISWSVSASASPNSRTDLRWREFVSTKKLPSEKRIWPSFPRKSTNLLSSWKRKRTNVWRLRKDWKRIARTFTNRNTDIEDELRREIAPLQKLIETLREQVTFERKRREVHDVNIASKTTTELVSGALSKGADRFSNSMT